MLRRRYRSSVPRTFLPPPGWPAPPAGWTPPVDWQPDPSWPPAPADWVWWADDEPAVDRSADLQTVGAAAFAPVHDAPTYAPGFQPTPPPPGFNGAPGLQSSGGFLPTGGPQHGTFQQPAFQPGGFQQGTLPTGLGSTGSDPSGFHQSPFPVVAPPVHPAGFQPTRSLQKSGYGTGAPPSFLHIADQLRAEARRRMGFGAVWLLGGIGVSVAATALLDGALYFWGAALYGIVQVLRGLVAYGRADKNALASSATVGIR